MACWALGAYFLHDTIAENRLGDLNKEFQQRMKVWLPLQEALDQPQRAEGMNRDEFQFFEAGAGLGRHGDVGALMGLLGRERADKNFLPKTFFPPCFQMFAYTFSHPTMYCIHAHRSI